MLTLHGFAMSNYYNKVKLALLEKGIAFDEATVASGLTDETVLAASPLGKIPFITTPQGALCESQAILEYLEAAYPDAPPLLPPDPWQAAKARELGIFVDLHLELVARELYPQAFFGGSVSENTQARVRRQLGKNVAAFKRLAVFGPYLGGDRFTLADCSGYVSLPLVALASRIVLGEDLLASQQVDWKAYVKLIGARAAAQKVDADRRADQERFTRASTAPR